MIINQVSSKTKEKIFKEMLVAEYLKHGSVDEVFRVKKFDLPISYAQYQRVLDDWGIVKAAGPNSSLGELLNFLSRFAEEKVKVEPLYRKMPHTFQTSLVTMYRVLSLVKEGIIRRVATGLVITPYNDLHKILVGRDISTPRLEIGKTYGSISIPVSFSRKRDSRETAILRVLQNEVFTKKAIERKMPEIIPPFPKPFMFLDIADIRVEIFHLSLPKKLSSLKNFSSFKLQNFKFIGIDSILSGKVKNLREGAVEVATGYRKYLDLKRKDLTYSPSQYRARLNFFLANLLG